MIEIKDLTVRFGGVIPLDAMTVTFESGTCGLIGPNGAGKTTFFNVLSGFVRAESSGACARSATTCSAMSHFRRARWGLRRTFQTEQAIEELSVFENVAMIHEHSTRGRSSRRADVLGAIEFVGLGVPIRRPGSARSERASAVSSRSRARSSASRVSVLLDEPAAGLPDEETEHLGEVIRRIPEHDRGARDPRRPRHGASSRRAAASLRCSTSAS